MFEELVSSQRNFFISGNTMDVDTRINYLKQLKDVVSSYEASVLDALKLDLGKPRFEAFISEVSHFYMEVDYAISHIKRWSKARRRLTPFLHFPAVSYTYRQPYGVVLIISPWNYPFDLAMVPLVYAIAAGNTAVVKPSEFSPNTAKIISKMLSEVFPEEYVTVVEGDASVARALLEQKFDYIFYTGSPMVGRYVMEAASKYLTPLTLELGGKSPVVIWEENNWDLAVKRIVWGKCFNAGQTCIAPDYVVLEKGRTWKFVSLFSKWIENFYGDISSSPDYARIVNERHFDRLKMIMDAEKGNILYGGRAERDRLFIEPTVVKATWDSPSMQDEIFGPVLPVIEAETVGEVLERVNQRPEPLAFYLFTSNRRLEEMFMRSIRSGAFISGDCLVHFVSTWLPFGGIGESGMGKYHGRWGFETFTNEKAIMKRPKVLDLPVRYPPYRSWKLSFIKKLGSVLTKFGL